MFSWWVIVIIRDVVFIKVLLKLILLMISKRGELLVRVSSILIVCISKFVVR